VWKFARQLLIFEDAFSQTFQFSANVFSYRIHSEFIHMAKIIKTNFIEIKIKLKSKSPSRRQIPPPGGKVAKFSNPKMCFLSFGLNEVARTKIYFLLKVSKMNSPPKKTLPAACRQLSCVKICCFESKLSLSV
jgi:hypothetical protein